MLHVIFWLFFYILFFEVTFFNDENIVINMKLKYLLLAAVVLFFISQVSASFTPDEGTFAFRQVEVYDINGVNFTVPTDFDITGENETMMQFKCGSDKLKISVEDDGQVKHVKDNPSKNITAEETMFGSVEGYFVDKNGTYTFSYDEGDKLVVIRSNDMSLMMGAMGKD